jgi:hypothetical protein
MKYFTLLQNRTTRNDGYFRISFPVNSSKSLSLLSKKLSSVSGSFADGSYNYLSLWRTPHRRYIVFHISKPSRSSTSYESSFTYSPTLSNFSSSSVNIPAFSSYKSIFTYSPDSSHSSSSSLNTPPSPSGVNPVVFLFQRAGLDLP